MFTALVCQKHAVLSLSVLTCISGAAGSFCWRRSSSFVRSGMRETLVICNKYTFINCHKMKLEQLYLESSSERLAFGMDGSGCGKQNPRVSEKQVPSRLRETGKRFHYFRLLRLLDISKESQTPQRHWERAVQQESTMIHEYMSTNSSAGSLRNGTHLSFHWTLSSNLFWVSFVSTYTQQCPLVRFVRLCFGLLVLRVNCFVFESRYSTGCNLYVYSARLPEARRTFPFRSHLYKRCSRLFLLASVVFICKKWYERNACNMQQIHIYYKCHKMKLEQLYSESSSERLAFGMDGSGCGKQNPRVSEKQVPSRLRETGKRFHYFRLLRLLDFSKESQTPRRLRERAGQQESTMIHEYMSTNSSAGSLRNGTHLSFHWTLSSNLFWVSFVSTYTQQCPLVRFVRLA
ncbi:Hypothetical_protein [Hexamita inflata]|uniref:Hypothetical_protein n=1 Tax=Hexamita inflata TaxID=28002 RepID=A0AA86QEW5_9EUKA|nr:Hypothetical protein HINF_LOCUS45050 [Hexamita inflata]